MEEESVYWQVRLIDLDTNLCVSLIPNINSLDAAYTLASEIDERILSNTKINVAAITTYKSVHSTHVNTMVRSPHANTMPSE